MVSVCTVPARGGRSCEHFGGYKTINRIPLPLHTYIHTCIHASVHTHIHTCIHIHTHAYMHPYIHTYIHTYIHYCTLHEQQQSPANMATDMNMCHTLEAVYINETNSFILNECHIIADSPVTYRQPYQVVWYVPNI